MTTKTLFSPELLPCPFCGAEPELLEGELANWVHCPTSSCMVNDMTVDEWNRRSPSPETKLEMTINGMTKYPEWRPVPPSPKVEGMPTRKEVGDAIDDERRRAGVFYDEHGWLRDRLVDARLALTKLKEAREKELREALDYGMGWAISNRFADANDWNDGVDRCLSAFLESKETKQKG